MQAMTAPTDKEIRRIDPRDLIGESYRIEGIGPEDCRSIFFDWAIGAGEGAGTQEAVGRLVAHYAPGREAHPMTAVLREGLSLRSGGARRRGGRRSRDG
jgi:hypothetical protein